MKKLKISQKDIVEKLYRAFVIIPRWKRRLIMWFWPEIKEVANMLRKFYWGVPK